MLNVPFIQSLSTADRVKQLEVFDKIMACQSVSKEKQWQKEANYDRTDKKREEVAENFDEYLAVCLTFSKLYTS